MKDKTRKIIQYKDLPEWVRNGYELEEIQELRKEGYYEVHNLKRTGEYQTAQLYTYEPLP